MPRMLTRILTTGLLITGLAACDEDDDDPSLDAGDSGMADADSGMADADGGMADADGGMADADGGMADADGGMADIDGGDDAPDPDMTAVRGRLDAPQSKQVEGALVTSTMILADGTLIPLLDETADVRTAANGSFSFQTSEAIGAESFVLVTATDGDAETSAIIEGMAALDDDMLDVPPLNAETTVESDVALEREAGASTDVDLLATIRTRVTPELVEAGPSEADIAALATVSATELATVDAIAAKAVIDATQAEVDNVREAEAEAYATLSAALLDAETEADADAALQVWATAVADARASLTEDAEGAVRLEEARAEAVLWSSAALSADVQASLRADAERSRADALHAMIVAAYELESDTTVADAFADLTADLDAAAEAGADASSTIETAWADYRAGVEAAIEANFSATEAAAVVAVEATVSTAVDTYVQMVADADAAVTARAEAISDGLVALRAALEATAVIDELTLGGFSEADATTWVRTAFHLELATATSGG